MQVETRIIDEPLAADELVARYQDCNGFCLMQTTDPQTGEFVTYAFLEPVEQFSWDEGDFTLEDFGRKVNTAGLSSHFYVPLYAGFIGYEALNYLEKIDSCSDSSALPAACFFTYRRILRISANQQVEILLNHDRSPLWRMEQPARKSRQAGAVEECCLDDLEKFSDFTRARYCETVEQIRDLISKGEVYQVNLSQKFTLPLRCSPAEFYSQLLYMSPARYSCFMNVNGVHIMSASPELFLNFDGTTLLTSPVKGTTRRSQDAEEDRFLSRQLLMSHKNLAELAMIVDLERNDLNRISKPGSVQVTNFPRLDSIAQVHHLVADVRSVPVKSDWSDFFQACFPSGSITGAPKIAAMTTIAKLEQRRRGVYTGSIGHIGSGNLGTFNIAIRTAVAENGMLSFQSGGGVVYDSEPESEYGESLLKARGMYLAYLASSR